MNDEALYALLAGVHQGLQSLTKTVEAGLRLLTPEPEQTGDRRPLTFLGANDPPSKQGNER